MKVLRLGLICCFCLVCLIASVASAQTSAFFEAQTMTPEVYDKLIIDAGAAVKLDENFSLRFFTLMNSGWAQAHFGPIWQPADWLQLGISLGGRQSPDGVDIQTAYLLGLKKGRVNFTGQVEVGRLAYDGDDSQVWYDLTLRVKTLEWLALGFKDRRPAGIGPLVEFNFWKMTAWAAWVPLDSERPEFDWARALLGLKICL